jgi:hypothetical protein
MRATQTQTQTQTQMSATMAGKTEKVMVMMVRIRTRTRRKCRRRRRRRRRRMTTRLRARRRVGARWERGGREEVRVMAVPRTGEERTQAKVGGRPMVIMPLRGCGTVQTDLRCGAAEMRERGCAAREERERMRKMRVCLQGEVLLGLRRLLLRP